VDQNWPGPPLAGPPGGLDGFDNFSARWEGVLVAPEHGTYEIGVEGDDGFRLLLDGKMVIDDWKDAPKRLQTTKVNLTQGQRVALKLDYFQGKFARGIRLSWRTPTDLRKLEGKAFANTSMETYLPVGADWYDFWTNEKHIGGQKVIKDSPLDILPLYVRAGSIVPMSPVMQYATERPDAPYEIRVYPGADGTFTIYEDDNETYAYEKGACAEIPVRWNEQKRTLTIGARKGSFPGMVNTRPLHVVLAGPGKAQGIAEAVSTAGQPGKTVRYIGNEIRLKF
jgi:alpha-D-xyloside xylohydrolase